SRLPAWIHLGMRIALPLVVVYLLSIQFAGLNLGMILSGLDLRLSPNVRRWIELWAQARDTEEILIHLLTLFVVAMVCHGELARRRPATANLTEFYLLLSLGGVLGGVFNSLVAPLIFTSVIEYPLVIVLA